MIITNGKKWVGVLIVVLVGGLAIGAGWYVRSRRAEGVCTLCRRPVHAESRALAELNGKREEACCPACVLRLRAQTGQKVRLIAVSDYNTHESLAPAQAAYVVGSDVVTCSLHGDHGAGHVDADKQPLEKTFDRCEPSILAFRSREAAVAFTRQHGGNIGTLSDLGIGQ